MGLRVPVCHRVDRHSVPYPSRLVMDVFLALSLALGLALACGMRSFLPPLLIGALAASEVGIDFQDTGWVFLEEPPFLLGVLLLAVAAAYAERRGLAGGTEPSRRDAVLAVAHVALGALLAGGAMASEGESAALGVALGAPAALGALLVIRSVLAGAQRRAGPEGSGALTLFADGAALAVTGLTVLFPPLALVAALGLLALARSRGRRSARKHEGLRILRG